MDNAGRSSSVTGSTQPTANQASPQPTVPSHANIQGNTTFVIDANHRHVPQPGEIADAPNTVGHIQEIINQITVHGNYYSDQIPQGSNGDTEAQHPQSRAIYTRNAGGIATRTREVGSFVIHGHAYGPLTLNTNWQDSGVLARENSILYQPPIVYYQQPVANTGAANNYTAPLNTQASTRAAEAAGASNSESNPMMPPNMTRRVPNFGAPTANTPQSTAINDTTGTQRIATNLGPGMPTPPRTPL